MKEYDAIIVGAGLSGLACANSLTKKGCDILILEASNVAGGRVATDQVDGFCLDRGFQVYLSAYPEGKRLFDYEGLHLHGFRHGAVIHKDGKCHRLFDPWREPSEFFRTLSSPLIPLLDKWRLQKFQRQALTGSFDRINRLSTMEFLKSRGFSDAMIENFWQPFYRGVFLEEDLSTPADFFIFTFKMFATGTACLPERGMGALPLQLTTRLPPGCLRLNSPVIQIAPQKVILAGGEEFHAQKIILATPPEVTGPWLGLEKIQPAYRSTTCVYFAAEKSPLSEPILVLNADKEGLIRTFCVPTDVSPGYGSGQGALISMSLGSGVSPDDHDSLPGKLLEECRAWFGSQVDSWRFLRTYHIARALPDYRQKDDLSKWLGSKGQEYGLCGDWTEDPSINGALKSGRLAAEQAMGSGSPEGVVERFF